MAGALYALGRNQLAAFGVIKDPEYEAQKETFKEVVEVAGAFFALLGLISAAETLRNFSQKSSEILLSVPCTYFLYNGYQLCQNVRTVADDPRTYSVVKGLPNGWDTKSCREQLFAKTICCEWMVDIAYRQLMKRLQQAVAAPPAPSPAPQVKGQPPAAGARV